MRRNVLRAGLVACGLTVIVPTPAFGSVQPILAWASTQSVGPSNSAWPADAGTWEEARDRLTIPLGPTPLDPWPFGPCRAQGAGGVH